ncbi:ABC transporter ATP-binding protein [Marinobacterium arenosum]|uniref:ABC transporter ATP-binding protein n=1 Tax=Marinobacterium arenosum TaxID=2862496 RepID=UPI0028F400EB|nr:ABC transporter ATP-binding protein [Marinobacterium arenosum]
MAIELSGLSFAWPKQSPILQIDHFALPRGERLFLQGPSGCGKSTLLNLVGGVLTPLQGEIRLLGQPLAANSARQRDRMRADHVGFIFQSFNLLPYLSLEENVMLPCRFSRLRAERARAQYGSERDAARILLAALELDEPALQGRSVCDLSVGQQQRVAAARALIGSPEIIIADEPTSALDSDARQIFIDLLIRECDATGSTLLFVSHDRSLQQAFDRSLLLTEVNRARGGESC